MNLKLDLGFRFWLRLDLPYIPGLNVYTGVPSRLAKYPVAALLAWAVGGTVSHFHIIQKLCGYASRYRYIQCFLKYFNLSE